jgi:hypothetical protein
MPRQQNQRLIKIFSFEKYLDLKLFYCQPTFPGITIEIHVFPALRDTSLPLPSFNTNLPATPSLCHVPSTAFPSMK